MTPRGKHPNKDIEAAVKYAESKSWHVEKSKGHAWGSLLCPEESQNGCIIRVWSTPRNNENHANQIIRFVNKCSHTRTSKKGGKKEK